MAISITSLRLASYRTSSTPLPQTLAESKRWGGKSAFLCHSHQDKDLVLGLLTILGDQGLRVYVDWQDSSMPEIPDEETAAKIKTRITAADLFLFLATPASLSSRWCPWELGCADGRKRHDQIVVIPTRDGSGTHGSEYMKLYRRIDQTANGPLEVFRPGFVYTSSPLSTL